MFQTRHKSASENNAPLLIGEIPKVNTIDIHMWDFVSSLCGFLLKFEFSLFLSFNMESN